MKTIYLDYAATTPVDPRVLGAMMPYFNKKFGNTMSLHRFGQEAKVALEQSREVVASMIGAKLNEIIFTSSATESNNLAIKGIAFANHQRGKHLIVSAIEHECIRESVGWLKTQGFEITSIPVDRYGLLDLEIFEKAIRPDTILVSIIHASNEIGTIQPIAEISKICRKKNVYFHTDCSQSFGRIPIDVRAMCIDLLTASSHKIYGPKGAACLFVREGVEITPLLHGGGHEKGIRSSTVNVPAVLGFAKACEICQQEMPKENLRLSKLRDMLIANVLKIKGSYLTGHATKRLQNSASFWFSGIEGNDLVIKLDLAGIAASTGSACSTIKVTPSPVLLALGLDRVQALGSLRFTLGRWTQKSEIDEVVRIVPGFVEELRNLAQK